MQKKTKTISIIMEDGRIDTVELLISFEFKDNKKEYVVYTKNEIDENGNITIYVSSVKREGDMPRLESVSDENEWSRIKNVLRELSKSDN